MQRIGYCIHGTSYEAACVHCENMPIKQATQCKHGVSFNEVCQRCLNSRSTIDPQAAERCSIEAQRVLATLPSRKLGLAEANQRVLYLESVLTENHVAY